MVRLGPFQLEHPFVLAPMAGITNSPFRRLMRRMDSALVVSELVSANGMVYGNQKTFEMLKFHDEERIVGLQIFGESTENLCQAAKYIEKLGVDFVDLNLGCPVPKVVKKGAGAAMCRDSRQLFKVLKALVESVQIPVSIKIRTGWDQNNRNALDVIHAAEDAGIAWVAIHGRTRAQGYSGEADWDFVGNLKAKSNMPMVGNGDIQTAEQAVRKYLDYGLDAVMIGRGALRNPFIFKQSKNLLLKKIEWTPNFDSFFSFLKDQKELLRESQIERLALIQSRKFLAWYSAGYPGSHEFRRKLFTTDSYEAVWNEALSFFESGYTKRSFEFLNEPFLMGGHG